MKKILLSFLFAWTAMVSNAQDFSEVEVVPGIDGPLPAMPSFSPPAANTFGGLFLEKVAYRHNSGFVVNGYWMNLDDYEADMTISDDIWDWGTEYFTLQYRTAGGTWTTATNEDSGDAHQYTSSLAYLAPVIEEDTDYRIVLHGGSKDGYTSNIVSAKMPTVHYSYYKRGWWSSPNYVGVGEVVSGLYVDMERQDRGTYNSRTGRVDYVTYASFTGTNSSYRYKWYRMNPLSYEMTPIQGATSANYTPTNADLGYRLVNVVTGDDQNISFYMAHDYGLVQQLVCCSFEYLGYDGFILNTNYVLPNGGKNLKAIDWSSSEEVIYPQKDIVELRPGQYVFAAPDGEPFSQETQYMIEYGDNSYYLTTQLMDLEGFTRNRFVETMYWNQAPLSAKVSKNTPVDVIGRNIRGEWGVVETIDEELLNSDDPYLYLLPGKYYLKARRTDTTLDTYYPNALIWSEATPVEPGLEAVPNDEGYYDYVNRIFDIALQPIPPALSGQGTIEGVVNVAASPSKAPRRASSSAAGITVYLKQLNGNIVAMTETDATGKYSFKKVPFGQYAVLVNVDGCTQEQTHEVTLTASVPSVTDVDYYVNKNEITTSGIPTDIVAVEHNNRSDVWYSIDGRRLSAKPSLPGLYIRNGKKYSAK